MVLLQHIAILFRLRYNTSDRIMEINILIICLSFNAYGCCNFNFELLSNSEVASTIAVG